MQLLIYWEIIPLYFKVPKQPRQNDTPQYQSNCNSLVSATGKHKKFLKEINRIWNNYQNIRITPPILGNKTFILLYSKATNHITQSDILQYHSNSHTFFSETRKHWKSFKETNKIWKKTSNFRMTPQYWETEHLLYSKVPNYPAQIKTTVFSFKQPQFGL